MFFIITYNITLTYFPKSRLKFQYEFSELSKKTLDSLRQPMEDKAINLSRSIFSIVPPCNFMLAAIMNPCPCGYYGDIKQKHGCKCSSAEIYKFYTKLSGPILDRFDIFIEVYSANLDKLIVNERVAN